MKRFRRVYFLLVIVVVLAIVGLAGSAFADTIVQSFKSSGTIQPNRVVAIKSSSSDTVELAPANQSQLIYGVAIDPTQAPVTLQRQANQQVFVANSGSYPVLVSTENGTINPGDYLSVSSTDGVAAKATERQTNVLGRALEKFDGTSSTSTNSQGGSAVGLVTVSIAVERNPLLKSSILIPSSLKRIGDSVAGKDVSALRIYAAMGIFLVAAIVALGLLAVGIRSAMTAIGRNPLSRHSILKSLTQVVVVSVTVLLLGTFSVYLLLKV